MAATNRKAQVAGPARILSCCDSSIAMEGGVIRMTCLQTGPKNFVAGVKRWQTHEGLNVGSVQQSSIHLLGEISRRHHHHVRIALLLILCLHHSLSSTPTFVCDQALQGQKRSHSHSISALFFDKVCVHGPTSCQRVTTIDHAQSVDSSKPTEEYNLLMSHVCSVCSVGMHAKVHTQ